MAAEAGGSPANGWRARKKRKKKFQLDPNPHTLTDTLTDTHFAFISIDLKIKINMIKNLKICNEIVMSYIGRKLRALLNFHLQYSLGGAVSNHARTHS